MARPKPRVQSNSVKQRALVPIVFLFIGEAQASQNQSFEQRIHEIYKKSHSQPTSDQQWDSLTQNMKRRAYRVQKDDTLWGLSRVFFGDGMFWPKIWSYNQSLTNPHLIQVGQEIRFFAGSLEEAPGVELTTEKTGAKVSESEMGSPGGEGITAGDGMGVENQEEGGAEGKISSLGGSGEDLPGETFQTISLQPPIQPVLKNLPSSFKETTGDAAAKYNEKGISLDLRPPIRINPPFVGHSFLYQGGLSTYPRVGDVVSQENNRDLSGTHQKIYIQSPDPLTQGEELRVMGRQYGFHRYGHRGDVIRYQGTVRIDRPVSEGIYQGTVLSSLDAIGVKSWVSREKVPQPSDDYRGRSNSTPLQVIGGGADNISRLFGRGDVVFLENGMEQGVQVGDIFGVYKRRDRRYSDGVVTKGPTPIAHLKVFRSERNTASAFVLDSKEPIVPGDETGEPMVALAPFSPMEDEAEAQESLLGEDTPPASGEDSDPGLDTLESDLDLEDSL